MNFKKTSFVGVLLALIVAAPVSAAILHDTTAGTPASRHLVGHSTHSGGGPPGSPPSFVINQPAGSFIVSGGSFTLDSLTLSLFQSQQVIEEVDPGTLEITRFKTGVGDDYEIRLWDTQQDSIGRDIPGNLLETFSTSSAGVVTLNSTLNPLLGNGLRYWVSAAIPEVSFPLSAGSWETVEIAPLGRAISFSNDATASWSFSNSTSALSLLVTGTAVPEPTAAVLMVLSAGVWLGRRR